MKAQVAARRFREDLFFRLSVFPITVPPLRERKGDISALARYFVDRFCRDLKKKPLDALARRLEALQAYRWPGNVRELQNCIERAVILADGDTIQPRHLNLSFVEPSRGVRGAAAAPGPRSTCPDAERRRRAAAIGAKSRTPEDSSRRWRGRTTTRAARPRSCGISYKALLGR